MQTLPNPAKGQNVGNPLRVIPDWIGITLEGSNEVSHHNRCIAADPARGWSFPYITQQNFVAETIGCGLTVQKYPPVGHSVSHDYLVLTMQLVIADLLSPWPILNFTVIQKKVFLCELDPNSCQHGCFGWC